MVKTPVCRALAMVPSEPSISGDKSWGFSHVVTLVLLILQFISPFEFVYGKIDLINTYNFLRFQKDPMASAKDTSSVTQRSDTVPHGLPYSSLS